MSPDQILDHFQVTNALLEGHFVLSSGLHSAKYLQCALALQLPPDASRYGRALANTLSERLMIDDVQTVASPAIGGLVIGFSVAQALGLRFIWTERQDGEMKLRRGFSVADGERILVIEDVITTGASTRECISALELLGGKVIAAASIIDRSNGTAEVGVPRVSLLSIDVPTYELTDCPLCAAGIPIEKPGSRLRR